MSERILITGSSGCIGRVISPFLENYGFDIRGLDKNPCEQSISEFIQGDIENSTVVRNAVRGMDMVIHLAGCANEKAQLSALVGPNLLGVFNVLEAMRLEGVGRIVLASSVHVTDLTRSREFIGTQERVPKSHYGLLKLCAEDMGKMYSRLYGISGVIARIGWVLRDQDDEAELKANPQWWNLFIGKNDLCTFFLQCARAPLQSLSVVYALSCQLDGERFDMTPSRELLGFIPVDTIAEIGIDYKE